MSHCRGPNATVEGIRLSGFVIAYPAQGDDMFRGAAAATLLTERAFQHQQSFLVRLQLMPDMKAPLTLPCTESDLFSRVLVDRCNWLQHQDESDIHSRQKSC